MNKKRKKVLRRIAGFLTTIITAHICSGVCQTSVVEAKSLDQYESLRAGAAIFLSDSPGRTSEDAAALLGIDEDGETDDDSDVEESNLVMADVKNTLNVREEPTSDSAKVGYLYSDCGGEILERRDGWTKIQSGNLVGWACDDFLLFGEEAEELAESVGISMATISTETLRVRKEPNTESGIYGLVAVGEKYEAVSQDEEWVCIDYEGKDAYVSAQYVDIEFIIDSGETLEEVKIREEEERKAKLIANYGVYAASASDEMLLAALIQCEAGGESYEGKLAVGAVVMNRVRSGAYPNTIIGVIYASGQFTPAGNGKVDTLLASGKVSNSCIQAAQDALAGNTNVGTATHFRRVNGHEGVVIGNHVFW